MAYTVKQVATISGVSIRTLHFYDETGLLKPAYLGTNGYRYYEEAQLLTLQQILFYRELGFELKQIKEVLAQAGFEVITALESHREALKNKLARTHKLLETIDKTIEHLKGTKKMNTGEMFAGFSVPAGGDRFGEHLKVGGERVDCKLSGQDTDGAMCVIEFTTGWPPHLHHEQDEWIYVLEGQFAFQVGAEHFQVGPGGSVFIPRKVAHVFAPVGGMPARMINVFQPACRIEEFFRELSTMQNLPSRDDVLNETYTEEQVNALHRLFSAYGMDLLGPPQVV